MNSKISINNQIYHPKLQYFLQDWVVIISATLFFFFEFIQMNMFNTVEPYLSEAFKTNATSIGGLSAAYFYGNIIFLFPAGILLDKYSVKRLLIAAFAFCIIFTFLFSVSVDLWQAEICRFFTGIGSSFCFLGCMSLIFRWFIIKKIALMTGIVVSIAMMGGVFAQAPFLKLIQMFGWRHAIMFNVFMGIFLLVVLSCFVKDYPVNFIHRNREDIGLSNTISVVSVFNVIRNSQNWFCGIYTSLMNLPIVILGAIWGTVYLVHVRHTTFLQGSYITSLIFCGIIIGSPIFGWIANFFDSRRVPMIFGVILAIFLVAILIFYPTLNFHALMLLFFTIGFVSGAQVLPFSLIASNNNICSIAAAEGISSTIVMCGGAIFQPLFGSVLDWNWLGTIANGVRVYTPHAYNKAMMIIFLSLITTFIVSLFIEEKKWDKKAVYK